ncbi:Putative ammonia monooxygenase [Marinovum algicola]|uniref:Ammonia monooxygenase n=1 Tax=Marinovum algicola TaxID=42444 RepID=A0A975WEU6_9RHOB|nr:AbrB family transcriptional regulator [Marinovum algicola]SEK09026.1 hypothetical protein SAMN04487940_12822 [Marinovum algicola]SLN71790.1 Putative ammonia monooxygenase [Marinovum algicola]
MTAAFAPLVNVILVLPIGLSGGLLAQWGGLPLPFLLGSVLASAAFAVATWERTGRPVRIPQMLRKVFIGVIGVLIGAKFSADVLAIAATLWLSFGAMALFVALAFLSSYLIFRRIGGYDRVTSVFCAMPGGLIEAVAFGERAGVDVRLLTVQHLARALLVVLIVPFGFAVFSGETVGGVSAVEVPSGWRDLGIVGAAVLAGLTLGGLLRLPASQLMGPLLLSGVLHATGVIDVHAPTWLLALAQVAVGCGLGSSFSGASLDLLGKAFAMSLLSVSLTLGLSVGFAFGLQAAIPLDFAALVISFAPGGITEMNLIALSLGISPVIVATHHLFRIVLTVALANAMWRWGLNRA